MIDYQIKNILSPQEIKYCNEYFEKSDKEYYDVWHNVVNVNKVEIDLSDIGMKHISNKLLFNNFRIRPFYMLEYLQDSFTQIHTDNDSNATSVTLFDASEDLVGGNIILLDSIKEKRCILSLSSKLGETFIYNGSIIHGVSKILSGRRRVMIMWYKP